MSYRDYCPECGKTCDYAYIYNDTHGIVTGCENCIKEVDKPNTPCPECGDESEFCIYKRNGQVIGCDKCIIKMETEAQIPNEDLNEYLRSLNYLARM